MRENGSEREQERYRELQDFFFSKERELQCGHQRSEIAWAKGNQLDFSWKEERRLVRERRKHIEESS